MSRVIRHLYLSALSKQLSCISFTSFLLFSFNSMSFSGCSALNGVITVLPPPPKKKNYNYILWENISIERISENQYYMSNVLPDNVLSDKMLDKIYIKCPMR